MSDCPKITMLVIWEQQRRLVEIDPNAPLVEIEKAITDVFQCSDVHLQYQLQYYDTEFESFVDLFAKTVPRFQVTLRTSQSHELSTIQKQAKSLQIVPKAGPIRGKLHDSDTYNFQQCPDELGPDDDGDDVSSISIEHADDNNDISTSNESDSDESSSSTRSKVDQNNTSFAFDNKYQLSFTRPLAQSQRLQFVTDMNRTQTSKSTRGGVLLRSKSKNGSKNRKYLYPVVQFKIPDELYDSAWYLYIYILTGSDEARNYYQHASKGIFNGHTERIAEVQNRDGVIPDMKLVNPYVIRLNKDDIRDGKYQLHVKVCNIKDVTRLKTKPLKKLPEIGTSLTDNDLATVTTVNTMKSLHFDMQQYRIGCILVQDQTTCALCISTLTIAERLKGTGVGSTRKRTKKHSTKRTKIKRD